MISFSHCVLLQARHVGRKLKLLESFKAFYRSLAAGRQARHATVVLNLQNVEDKSKQV